MNDVIRLDNPTIDVVAVDGRIETCYIVLRDGINATETIRINYSDGLRLLIDVDDDDLPIAVQFLQPVDLRDVGVKTPKSEDTATFFREVFLLALQTVQNYRMMEDKTKKIRATYEPRMSRLAMA